jgi:solute carrier family 10 (sodium/bile acid cotransporter), member 7
MRLTDRLAKAGLNAFFFCLLGTVLLAWLFPSVGSSSSPVPLAEISRYGVSVIFFFYGVQLNIKDLLARLGNWRLHVLIQATTFLFFPLLAIAIRYFFGNDSGLWLGFYYLAVLPSTVSSSVVMVSIAGGNVPAAIFNASVSSIIGIFITPLWMSLYLVNAGEGLDLSDVILKLCLQVLLPVIAGMLFNNKLGTWVAKYKAWLRYTDQFIILLIVFTAFSESFSAHMFDGFTAGELALLSGGMLLFFLVMAGLMYLVSSMLGFSAHDRITVIFCGSKKSLVQGAVMGSVLFPDPVMFGVVLLPLMLYHALQLMAGSMIARTMNNDN